MCYLGYNLVSVSQEKGYHLYKERHQEQRQDWDVPPQAYQFLPIDHPHSISQSNSGKEHQTDHHAGLRGGKTRKK